MANLLRESKTHPSQMKPVRQNKEVLSTLFKYKAEPESIITISSDEKTERLKNLINALINDNCKIQDEKVA